MSLAAAGCSPVPDEPNEDPEDDSTLMLSELRTDKNPSKKPNKGPTKPVDTTVEVPTTEHPDEPTGGPTEEGAVVGPWHGVYLPHGWIASPRTPAEIASRVALVAGAGFNHQIHNVGFLDPAGTIPSGVADGLVAWTEASKAAAPDQGVIAWISGSETTHVDNPQTWVAIADSTAALVERAGLDGILFDLEPFSPDNESLLGLLQFLRDRLPSTWIGITAPIPQGRWSPDFIRRVSALVDAVSPMAYDSTVTNPDQYATWVSDGLERYQLNLSPNATLLPSLPAYKANRWHDPAVENLTSAREALANIGGVDGAAVYWWWEMNEDDLTAWSRLTS